MAAPKRRLVVVDGYTINPGDLSWDSLEPLVQAAVYDRSAPEEIVSRCQGAELVLTNKAPLNAATIAALPELRYIGVTATGYDIVDIAAARARGILVTNVPAYGTASVAQFVFALLLELCHRVQRHDDAVRRGEWSRSPDWCFWLEPTIELAGKTLGIIGFGRIGRQVAKIGDALGMRILASDPVRADAPAWPGFAWAQVDELLGLADVITLHCPLTERTKALIDSRALALMKPAALLINTARGPLVADRDLAAALNAGRIAGAALDVLPTEPPSEASPLLHARNCIVTPHIAWATREARRRLLVAAVENVAAFLAGSPRNIVGE